ncbi:hypothetical protein CSP5_1263 [Cuniculiplasma divulgatum]|uniref:Uncharacterized protein n=1 Tax=Cuniculiplasma divulgatum TaxID=1673428 RepID=A0A1N5V6X1_9ARCH|nr:hypothetical protein CSP5_1263 [Cuniculiplasma divulgatum]
MGRQNKFVLKKFHKDNEMTIVQRRYLNSDSKSYSDVKTICLDCEYKQLVLGDYDAYLSSKTFD